MIIHFIHYPISQTYMLDNISKIKGNTDIALLYWLTSLTTTCPFYIFVQIKQTTYFNMLSEI